jgi:nuclear pore complex protein Nup205
MAEPHSIQTSLHGLFQDLSAIPDGDLSNVDRLCHELETHIQDFRKLLDKPGKNNASRQAVLSGEPSLSRFLNSPHNRDNPLTSNAIF